MDLQVRYLDPFVELEVFLLSYIILMVYVMLFFRSDFN